MNAIPYDDFIVDSPLSLFTTGILKGKAIPLNFSPFEALPGTSRRIWTGKLRSDAASTITGDGVKGLVAVKIAEELRQMAPRDLRREAKLLGKMNHFNILSLLNAYLIPATPTTNSTFYFFTPLYPLTLSTLLDSPLFTSELESFDLIVHSLTWQMIEAIAYIHSEGISHRDVAPSNFVIARNGRLVLIDFGISIEENDEDKGSMHFEVGTGPYRAPELLFGARTYNIFQLDLWALGATLSTLFSPFSTPPPLPPSSPSNSSSSSSSESKSSGRWDDDELEFSRSSPIASRQTLFKGGASDFVLIGSIFKICGGPTLESWPEAQLLPDFSRFTFAPQDPIPLDSLLPHLPPSPSPILPIIEGLLRISASTRLSAEDALHHPLWVEVVVLDPEDVELGKLFEQFL